MRVISDNVYAELIKELKKDPKVSLFQALVMAPKIEPSAVKQNNTEEGEKTK